MVVVAVVAYEEVFVVAEAVLLTIPSFCKIQDLVHYIYFVDCYHYYHRLYGRILLDIP